MNNVPDISFPIRPAQDRDAWCFSLPCKLFDRGFTPLHALPGFLRRYWAWLVLKIAVKAGIIIAIAYW